MIFALPLLHVSQAAPAAVDLQACLWAFVIAAATGALLGLGSRFPADRQLRRRTAAVTVSALAFFALLPSVVPYDHLLTQDNHSATGAAVHASHCHDTPSACADAPIPSGPGQMLDTAPLIVVPVMLSILLLATAPMLVGVTRKPEVPPPLLMIAASI